MPLHRRRAAYYTLCAALFAGTLILLYLTWQAQPHVSPAPRANDRPGPNETNTPTAASPRLDELAITAPLAFDPDSEPLERVPADLPAPAGGTRQWAFQRRHADAIEQVMAWRIEGESLDRLAAHYTAAAQARGFTPLPAASDETPPGAARVLSFTAPHADDPRSLRVLTLRLRPRGGAVHLLIALRYAIPQD
ncbi:MAG: hypothetical protein ACODAQ_03025 [Phycisphaeraceae bacterium]